MAPCHEDSVLVVGTAPTPGAGERKGAPTRRREGGGAPRERKKEEEGRPDSTKEKQGALARHPGPSPGSPQFPWQNPSSTACFDTPPRPQCDTKTAVLTGLRAPVLGGKRRGVKGRENWEKLIE